MELFDNFIKTNYTHDQKKTTLAKTIYVDFLAWMDETYPDSNYKLSKRDIFKILKTYPKTRYVRIGKGVALRGLTKKYTADGDTFNHINTMKYNETIDEQNSKINIVDSSQYEDIKNNKEVFSDNRQNIEDIEDIENLEFKAEITNIMSSGTLNSLKISNIKNLDTSDNMKSRLKVSRFSKSVIMPNVAISTTKTF